MFKHPNNLNCLGVSDRFVGLARKGLKFCSQFISLVISPPLVKIAKYHLNRSSKVY